MSQALDLKQLERLAFRRTYQDGLYDIYIGGMIRQLRCICVYGISRQRGRIPYSPALPRPWPWLERSGLLAGQEIYHPAPHRAGELWSGAPQA